MLLRRFLPIRRRKFLAAKILHSGMFVSVCVRVFWCAREETLAVLRTRKRLVLYFVFRPQFLMQLSDG